jgi:hypothetical protein
MHVTAASTETTAHAALLKPQNFITCAASVALQHRIWAELTAVIAIIITGICGRFGQMRRFDFGRLAALPSRFMEGQIG